MNRFENAAADPLPPCTETSARDYPHNSPEERDIMESYDLGANSSIRKTVDISNFLEAVRQLSLYWLVLNEAPRIF